MRCSIDISKNLDRRIAEVFQRAAETSRLLPYELFQIKDLSTQEMAKAHSPLLFARPVEKALTVRRSKAAYSLKPDWQRCLLEKLPTRLADALFAWVLRS